MANRYDSRSYDQLDPITSPDDADLLPILDVSDTTDSADGTKKKVTWSNLKDQNTSGLGVVAGISTTVSEKGNYAVKQTILTLDSEVVSVTSVGNANGVGGTSIYSLPEGHINILGATASLTVGVASQGDFADGAVEGDLGVGTLAPENADSLGTDATDDNICTAASFTMLAFEGSADLAPDTGGMLIDATAVGQDIVLTALVDSAYINDDTTTDLTVSGTITILWANLGDY